MPKFILNPKNKKGIIAEIVGENMLRIQKRKTDHFPINIVITGKNYDVVATDTLSGDPVYIECVDGKIKTDSLLIEERNNPDEQKPEDKQNPEGGDTKPGTGDGDGSGDGTGKPSGDTEPNA